MALPLGKLTILVGAGIIGSVLAKEGGMSDFVSGAFKLAWRQLKRDDSSPSVNKPRNDSLMAQVNNLRQELQILASNRSITIVNSSRTASGATKYGTIIVVIVVGYGYIWWKGWKLPDMMFATRRSLSDACNSIGKQLENVTKQRLSSQIDGLDHSLDECLENTIRTQQEVSELLGKTDSIGVDVKSVHDAVQSLETKIYSIEEKQNFTTGGLMKLCDYASRIENSRTSKQIQTGPSSSRPALDLTPSSPSRTGSLPPSISEPLSPPVSSGSHQDASGISEAIETPTGREAANGISTLEDSRNRAREIGNRASESDSLVSLGSFLIARCTLRTQGGTKMETVRSQRKSAQNDVVSTLPLYRSAPVLEVRLEDFELFAIDRLRVLKGISDGLSRGKKPEEMEKLAMDLWKTNMRHPQASNVVNKDIISHFVLRLLYCRTEELRKWFLSMETALFRYRFRHESLESQRALMAEFELPYKAVGNAEFESLRDKLQVSRSNAQPLSTADAIFYKVPFEEVPELVAGRRVFLQKGLAYIASNQVVSLVGTQFRSHLSKALILTNRKWTSTVREQEKDRLTPIVEALCSSYLGPDYSQPKGFAEVSVKDIDELAKSSFPLCMCHLFGKLREDHHLKHGGRMQLGLFLKGVGLKLDDAITFWKAEFSRKVGAERFDKEYAYSIRHNYGREGKRTDYTPYSCQKIILSTPGVGDHHGCPYRHFSEENLRAALSKMGVNSRAVEDVMDKVRNKHYQVSDYHLYIKMLSVSMHLDI
ncbi:hypothetical protein FNV43_RR25751 [Rhamnella rubrinervis]|uniref:DNA primase large subunit n=1 Tax=Rhamnella rubrinervis TaxID=2594499 RepID=A0A8K0GN63_9ROSA|nr:hypothetical protein FNV43_RR25751 [Rhamnella rubrinervis]